jgi:hypothetical protein
MVIQHPTILEEGQGSPSQSQHSMLGQHVPGVQHYTMTPHQTLEVNGHLIEMTNEAAGGLGSPTQSIRSDHEMFVDGNMEVGHLLRGKFTHAEAGPSLFESTLFL